MIGLYELLKPDLFLDFVAAVDLPNKVDSVAAGQTIFALRLKPLERLTYLHIDENLMLHVWPDTEFEARFCRRQDCQLELRLCAFNAFFKSRGLSYHVSDRKTANIELPEKYWIVRRAIMPAEFCRFALLHAAVSIATEPFEPDAWRASSKKLGQYLSSVQAVGNFVI